MFSSSEMAVLYQVSEGNNTVPGISKEIGKSIPQIYKIVGSLRKKDTLHLQNGKLIPERKPHIALLFNIFRESNYAQTALSGLGLEILSELTEPKTVFELSILLEVHQTSISKKVKQLYAISMLQKKGASYAINIKLWSELGLENLAIAYKEYRKTNDIRTPPCSTLHYITKNMVIFDDPGAEDFVHTAFSKYDDYGVGFYPGTYYCAWPPKEPTIQEVFLHSLYIISNDSSWRLKMMALIFYVKYKAELRDISHPIKDDMDTVLRGERVKGWVKLWEMQQRADMFGVVLK